MKCYKQHQMLLFFLLEYAYPNALYLKTEYGYILCLTLFSPAIHTNKSCRSLVIHYIFQAMLLHCFVFKVSQQKLKCTIPGKHVVRQHKTFPLSEILFPSQCPCLCTSEIYMLKLIHSQTNNPQHTALYINIYVEYEQNKNA